MGFISNLFGGDSSGQGFQAKNPFTSEQQQQAIIDSQNALKQQNALVQALQAQGGLQNQSNVFNQLQNVASGQGPNPAQAQLAQATAANTANQAALMAGQRGAGANAGLLARQAAMQGAANQQNMAGQAATLQAQQSLNALGQMGGIAGQQAQQLQAGVSGAGQIAGQNQQAMMGGVQSQNAANAEIAKGNAQRQGGALAGLLGAAGTALAGPVGGAIGSLFASGASSPAPIAPGAVSSQSNAPSGRQMPMMASGGMVDKDAPQGTAGGGNSRLDAGWGKVIMKAHGGEIPGGPKSHHGKHLKSMKEGGAVPGQAKVAGDSYANDTKHVLLSPGEIVIPRHITQGKDAAKKAAEFVAAILAKNGAPK